MALISSLVVGLTPDYPARFYTDILIGGRLDTWISGTDILIGGKLETGYPARIDADIFIGSRLEP